MPRGLTYTSQSAAEQQARDYRNQGLLADVKQTGPLEWKVYLKEGLREPTIDEIIRTQGVLTEEETEEEQIQKGIKQKRINQQIERATRPTEKQEVNAAVREAKRKLAVKTALEKTPEESQKAFIDRKKKNLEETIIERTKRGKTPGVIVPIYDQETNKIIDYRLDTGNGGAELEKKFRSDIKKVGDVPLEVLKSSDNTLRSMTRGGSSGRSVNFRSTVQGGNVGQPGGISNMQRPGIGTNGAVGMGKPSIAQVQKPDLDKIQIQTKGTIKASPNVDKLMVNIGEMSNPSIDDVVKKKDTQPWGVPYMKDNPEF